MRLAAPTVLALAAAVCAAIPSALRAQTLFDRAEACLTAPDRPICLIRAATADGRTDIVAYDEELPRRPDLLADAGLTLEPQAPQEGLAGEIQRLGETVTEAFRQDRLGRPAAEVLAPILAAPAPGSADLRLAGLSLVVLSATEGNGRWPTPALTSAAMRAWEDGLAARWSSPMGLAPPEELALAYARLGDEAGLDRTLRLLPTPSRRVQVLLTAGRLDAALALARALTPEAMIEPLRAEAAREAELARQEAEAQAAASERIVSGMLADIRAQEGPKARRREALMRSLLTPPAEPEPPRPSDAALRRAAILAVRDARLAVVEAAAKAGRPQAARDLADTLLNETPAGVADESLLGAAGALAAAATPSRAESWLGQLDATFARPARSNDASMMLQGRIMASAAGWRALGRDDRIDALVTRLKPLAMRERARSAARPNEAIQTPALWQLAEILIAADRVEEVRALAVPQGGGRLLENDIKRGRGIARLDEYLADARTESNQNPILTACYMASERRGAFADVLTCLRRRQHLATRPELYVILMDTAIGSAAAAADADKLEEARALLAFALEAGLPAYRANPQFQSMAGFLSRRHLLQIAKAELRAQGRLPPRTRPKTMLGPPP